MATYLQGKPGIYKITNTVNNKIYFKNTIRKKKK